MAADSAELLLHGGEASDPDCFVVQSPRGLARLAADIIGERDDPIVGVTLRNGSHEPVLRASDVRGVVGAGVRIYLLPSGELILGLQEIIGRRLALWPGALRIWWPGASTHCDPEDHPIVMGLDDEDYLVTLEELAHEYDLSRPRVRKHVRLIEDTRAFLQAQLSEAREQDRRTHERLRDTQIECHELRVRLEAAPAVGEAPRRRAEPEP